VGGGGLETSLTIWGVFIGWVPSRLEHDVILGGLEGGDEVDGETFVNSVLRIGYELSDGWDVNRVEGEAVVTRCASASGKRNSVDIESTDSRVGHSAECGDRWRSVRIAEGCSGGVVALTVTKAGTRRHEGKHICHS